MGVIDCVIHQDTDCFKINIVFLSILNRNLKYVEAVLFLSSVNVELP